jgi:hypothetical protein
MAWKSCHNDVQHAIKRGTFKFVSQSWLFPNPIRRLSSLTVILEPTLSHLWRMALENVRLRSIDLGLDHRA